LEVRHYPVSPDDWPFILKIRNEEDVRKSSFNTEIIMPETHNEYMRNLDARSDIYQRILVCDHEKVGYIKVIEDEVSYMIKKEYRGKGIMKISFSILEKDLKKMGKIKVKASVKVDNLSSLRLVEKMGYQICNTIYRNGRPYYHILEKQI
jgi:RimJ/RimL family protein N-acetyltransferase